MAEKKIVDYIRNGLVSGYKQKELEKVLQKKGWMESDISQAIKEAKKQIKQSPQTEKKTEQKTEKKPEKKTEEKPKDMAAMPFEEKDGKPVKKRGFFSCFRRRRKSQQESGNETKAKTTEKIGKDEKESKPGKATKEKAIPITYKKPSGKLTTEVDDMLEIISQRKNIRINQLAKLMKVKESEVKEWTETLENWGIIEVHYPLFGKPVVTMSKKKKDDKYDQKQAGQA